MPVFGRAGSRPGGVPKFLAPTPAPASLTDSDTARVALGQTMVCCPRATLYQIAAVPVFIPLVAPLVMGWFSALGTPTAKAALTAAALATSGGTFPPTQTVVTEAVTVDKWYQNLNSPPLPAYTVSYSNVSFPAIADEETITLDKWFASLSWPRVRLWNPAHNPLAYGVGVVQTVAQVAYWYVPLSEPPKAIR